MKQKYELVKIAPCGVTWSYKFDVTRICAFDEEPLHIEVSISLIDVGISVEVNGLKESVPNITTVEDAFSVIHSALEATNSRVICLKVRGNSPSHDWITLTKGEVD